MAETRKLAATLAADVVGYSRLTRFPMRIAHCFRAARSFDLQETSGKTMNR
jgi:hypothetical protein